jgi:CRISPR/Cas system CMR subunit Cmr4 (Cas7 group RAMP superfamily)
MFTYFETVLAEADAAYDAAQSPAGKARENARAIVARAGMRTALGPDAALSGPYSVLDATIVPFPIRTLSKAV